MSAVQYTVYGVKRRIASLVIARHVFVKIKEILFVMEQSSSSVRSTNTRTN